MKPNFSQFEKLKNDKLNVGCNNESFVQEYVRDVLGFDHDKIKVFNPENDYTTEFERNSIAAAFLELPYERLFLNQHCKSYSGTKATYRFGGLGFVSIKCTAILFSLHYDVRNLFKDLKHGEAISLNVSLLLIKYYDINLLHLQAFQKGSPFAADFSREILCLSEEGNITLLEEKWFAPSPECSTSATNNNVESLSLRSFKGIYIVFAAISTICFLLFLFRLLRNSRPHHEADGGHLTPRGKSGTKYFYNGEKTRVPRRASTFAQALDKDEWGSTKWEYVSNSDNLENNYGSPQAEIEMPKIPRHKDQR
jgi:ionotropic glutamate receptor